MDKMTAVELAHQIQELLKTREAIKLLEAPRAQVLVSEDIKITIRMIDHLNLVVIPPHVMRYLVENGALLKACKALEMEHEEILSEIAGVTVEKN